MIFSLESYITESAVNLIAERVIFVREPNTEEVAMSKFYAAVGGDLSDVLERLEDLDIVKFYLPGFENDPSYTVLMQSLKDGDRQRAFRAAHTLKGLSYNFGLDRLGNCAAALCRAMREGQSPSPELLRQLTEEYECVIDAIHELINGI